MQHRQRVRELRRPHSGADGQLEQLVSVVALEVVFGLVVIAILYFVDPSGPSLYPACPFHALTGLHCPLCGSTRALHQFLHGHIGAAVSLNAAVVLGAPLVVSWYLWIGVRQWRNLPAPSMRQRSRLVWALLAMLALFGIARNLPFHPFTLLAPH
jgi:hypothetical protein